MGDCDAFASSIISRDLIPRQVIQLRIQIRLRLHRGSSQQLCPVECFIYFLRFFLFPAPSFLFSYSIHCFDAVKKDQVCILSKKYSSSCDQGRYITFLD
jgi:hypothetical protein